LKNTKNTLRSLQNLKAFDSGQSPNVIFEFPLYSDANIKGHFDSPESPYRFINLFNQQIKMSGDVFEALTLRVYDCLPEPRGGSAFIRKDMKTDVSTYHGGDYIDEITCITSLFLGIRLKAGSKSRMTLPDNPLDGKPSPNYKNSPTVNIGAYGPVIPDVTKCEDLSLLSKLILLKNLKESEYVELLRAAKLYNEALWLADSDPQTAWLFLISAVEVAANEWFKKDDTPQEKLRSLKPDLSGFLIESGGPKVFDRVAEEFGHLLGSTNKFIKFCKNFMPPKPKTRPIEEYQVKWSKTGIGSVLSTLYGHRSKTLHSGLPFPALLLFPPIKDDKQVFAEVSMKGLSMYGGSWCQNELPMNLNTFYNFATSVLNKWVDDLIVQSESNHC
tara:strand:+ start:7400 stop:8560 length:1161 start_codon:yes stop_codon:yes gene_type:complete